MVFEKKFDDLKVDIQLCSLNREKPSEKTFTAVCKVKKYAGARFASFRQLANLFYIKFNGRLFFQKISKTKKIQRLTMIRKIFSSRWVNKIGTQF